MPDRMGATEDDGWRRLNARQGPPNVAGEATYFNPSCFLIAAASDLATPASLPKLRLRFADFFSRLWLFIA
jgi:hypothetical protein